VRWGFRNQEQRDLEQRPLSATEHPEFVHDVVTVTSGA
jgi:hypothetical protein